MDLRLRGRKVIVTGGTKGIGRAIAEAFAGEGADVAVCARNAADVARTVQALKERGVDALGAALDVADATALGEWVGNVGAHWGALDIVVANVSALAIANEPQSWRREFDTDMMGTVHLVDAAMPFLEASTAASIVAISSVSGREIDFAAGPYGVFKAALVHYTQGLAHQLAGKGIRANAVSPGKVYFEAGVWEHIRDNDPQLYAQALALNPTGRMGRPEEIARAVVFVASPAASFISGANIVVDGALTRGVQL